MTEITIGQLKEDPVLFSEHILGIHLHEGQKAILACKDRFICVRAARRFGKSFVFSSYAAWAIATHSNFRVIVVSRIQRQSLEMFKTIKDIIMASPLADSVTRCTMTELVMSNGSYVQSLPGSSPNTLRGITADLVMVDEAAYVPEEAFTELYPTVISTRGRMILISTPGFNSGEFYRACQDGSEYTKFHFTHANAVWENGDPFINPEELEREVIRCGGIDSAEYAREYLAEFGNAEGAFFNFVAIDEALRADIKPINTAEQGHTYVIGVDIGQVNDYTVIAVMDITESTALKVVELTRFRGESSDAIMLKIHDSTFRFNARKVLIDEGGIGKSIIEHLHLKHPGLPYNGFNFNVSTKPRIMMNLSILLNRRELLLPDDIDVQKELKSFEYSENPNTRNVKLGGANGVHDDIPIALALAVEAAELFKPLGTLAFGISGHVFTKPKNRTRRNVRMVLS